MKKTNLKAKEKYSKGITLVALIVTIIVLLILTGVTIITLTGDNGLLTKSKSAVDKYSEGEIEEQIKLAYTEWKTAQLTGTTESASDFIKNRLNTSIENVEDVSADDNALTVTINKGDEEKTYYYNVKKGTIKQIELALNSNNKKDNYVGCYADIDEDGVVDGVIFVDLLTGSVRDTQKWIDDSGAYTLPTDVTEDNTKKYYISQQNYTDSHFGTHHVLSPVGSGKDRFYVMELSDFTTPEYTDENDSSKSYPAYTNYLWYKGAFEKMTIITSYNFGEGRENTRKMIAKWNAAGTSEGWAGAEQDNQDIWKHIQSKYEEGWYIPSKEELAAFANEIGGNTPITSTNYNSVYGLNVGIYWTSSQSGWNRSKCLVFYDNRSGIQESYVKDYKHGVRLVTTF